MCCQEPHKQKVDWRLTPKAASVQQAKLHTHPHAHPLIQQMLY